MLHRQQYFKRYGLSIKNCVQKLCVVDCFCYLTHIRAAVGGLQGEGVGDTHIPEHNSTLLRACSLASKNCLQMQRVPLFSPDAENSCLPGRKTFFFSSDAVSSLGRVDQFDPKRHPLSSLVPPPLFDQSPEKYTPLQQTHGSTYSYSVRRK